MSRLKGGGGSVVVARRLQTAVKKALVSLKRCGSFPSSGVKIFDNIRSRVLVGPLQQDTMGLPL